MSEGSKSITAFPSNANNGQSKIVPILDRGWRCYTKSCSTLCSDRIWRGLLDRHIVARESKEDIKCITFSG